MRCGVPSASTSRSSGAVTKPSGGPGKRRVGLHLPRLAARLDARRRRLGKGRLVAEAAGQSMEPSRICSRCSMRQVWKPLAWAEMPRMACIETGRPTIFSWQRPVQSVHGMSSVDLLARRRRAPVRRRCAGWWRPARRSARRRPPARSRAPGSARRSAGSSVTTRRPSGSLKRAHQLRRASGDSAGMGEPEWSVQHQRPLPCASRANSPSSAPPGFSITSQGALV